MRSVASGLFENREHRLVVRFTTLISVVKDVLVDCPAKIVVCHGQELFQTIGDLAGSFSKVLPRGRRLSGASAI
jgi:hypothetical protein